MEEEHPVYYTFPSINTCIVSDVYKLTDIGTYTFKEPDVIKIPNITTGYTLSNIANILSGIDKDRLKLFLPFSEDDILPVTYFQLVIKTTAGKVEVYDDIALFKRIIITRANEIKEMGIILR